MEICQICKKTINRKDYKEDNTCRPYFSEGLCHEHCWWKILRDHVSLTKEEKERIKQNIQ